jgi:uracil phosphoribosyltransferase
MAMPQVHVSQHPLVKQKLTLMRDIDTKPKKFRELVREISILMAYEATADIALKENTVTTPMGAANGYELSERSASCRCWRVKAW